MQRLCEVFVHVTYGTDMNIDSYRGEWKVVPKQYWYQHRHSVCLNPRVSNTLDLLFNRGDLPYFGYLPSSCFEVITQIYCRTSAMFTTFWDPTFGMFYLPILLCLWMFPRWFLRLFVLDATAELFLMLYPSTYINEADSISHMKGEKSSLGRWIYEGECIMRAKILSVWF